MRFAPITLALLSAATFATFVIAVPVKGRFTHFRAQLKTKADLDPNNFDANSKEAGRFAVLAPKLEKKMNETVVEGDRKKFRALLLTAKRQRDYYIRVAEELKQKETAHPTISLSAAELRDRAEREYALASAHTHYRAAATHIALGASCGALSQIIGGPPRMNTVVAEGKLPTEEVPAARSAEKIHEKSELTNFYTHPNTPP